MGYVGDVVPYEHRQQVLGRFLTGQISGLLFGQVAGGVLGDWFGWRNVFFILAGIFAAAAVALIAELAFNPRTRASSQRARRQGGLISAYASVLRSRWARFIIVCVFFEAALLYAVLSFIGADMHLRFGLGFTLVGIVVGFFAVGGLIYTFLVSFLVNRLGQIGMVILGGLFVSLGYLTLVFQPVWWLSFGAMVLIGMGFYMVHNTFQTNATQMAPQARGTALALFSSVLYAGITVGVAISGLIVDRYTAVPVFLAAAIGFPMVAGVFALGLARKRRAEAQALTTNDKD
jgi:predicted MFS family arabinose efflux permease